MKLEGKTAVITGASAGIGRATALLFAEEGADQILTGRRPELLEELANEIRQKYGRRVVTVQSDVAKTEDVMRIADAVKNEFGGKLDILFNNAGIEGRLPPKPIEDMDIQDWCDVIAVNLTGTFLCTRFCVPFIKANGKGSGSIINNASILGRVGFALTLAYSASKGGVIQFTKSLALELAPFNIRVNAVAPGFIVTPMVDRFTGTGPGHESELERMLISLHPLGRLGRPEEIAKGVLFLASDDASFITGESMVIDGGYTAQ